MKLESLKEASGSSSEIHVVCCNCKNKAPWSKAAKEEWKADSEGKSFEAYYCNDCSKEVLALSHIM